MTTSLSKFLAIQGLTSRRKATELIKSGRVQINGDMITNPAYRITPEFDKIMVDSNPIKTDKKVYILLNKPPGVVSTARDTHNRPIVTELVPVSQRLYPVGRLDQDTTGLILLTNDGELAYRLTHPKFHIPKTYELVIRGPVGQETIRRLREGVLLDDGITALTQVTRHPGIPIRLKADIGTIGSRRIIGSSHNPPALGLPPLSRAYTLLHLTLYEGRKRQIRRMCQALKLTLVSLKRIAIGPLKLGNLQEGQWRELMEIELEELYKSVNLRKSALNPC